jgi:hypothetical protein
MAETENNVQNGAQADAHKKADRPRAIYQGFFL